MCSRTEVTGRRRRRRKKRRVYTIQSIQAKLKRDAIFAAGVRQLTWEDWPKGGQEEIISEKRSCHEFKKVFSMTCTGSWRAFANDQHVGAR